MRAAYHHGQLAHALRAAAADLLAAGEDPSLRSVARRVGVAPSAVYHHFADKEALIAAVAEEGFDVLQARQQAIHAPDPVDHVVALSLAYVGLAVERPAHFAVMFRGALKDPARHPDLAAAADRAFDALVAAVARAAPAADARALALTVWSFAHGVAELIVQGPLRMKLGDDWPAFVAAATRGIVTG